MGTRRRETTLREGWRRARRWGRLARRWWRRGRRLARRARRAWKRAHPPPAAYAALAILALVLVNTCYQVARKPTEILGAVAPSAAKDPAATWAEYGALFDEHSTEIASPELLAALVQVESAGDPLARTYWRWRWSWNPLEIYAPASSAVGILQITDGTFEEARHYCIHRHAVARDGPWWDPTTCWFNAFYFRTVPSHAIEMTAARLHQVAEDVVAEEPGRRASLEEERRLAAAIHLCGKDRGRAFARHGFRALPGERCGDHDLHRYLARVEALEARFAAIRAAPP